MFKKCVNVTWKYVKSDNLISQFSKKIVDNFRCNIAKFQLSLQFLTTVTNYESESDTSNNVIIKTAQNCLLSKSKYSFFFFKTNLFVFTKSLSCFHVTSKKKTSNKQKSYHTNHPKSSHVWTFFFFLFFLSSWCFFIPKHLFLPSQKKSNQQNMIFRYFAVLLTFSYLYFEGHVTFELSKVGWYRIAMTWLC